MYHIWYKNTKKPTKSIITITITTVEKGGILEIFKFTLYAKFQTIVSHLKSKYNINSFRFGVESNRTVALIIILVLKSEKFDM